MNADGTDDTQLTDDSVFVWPDPTAWSPDGTKIAFTRVDYASDGSSPNYEIYVMNADGSGQTNLTNTVESDHEPTWSPDGERIALMSVRDDDPDWEIYMMNVDGSDQINLTNTDGSDRLPTWSPDGTKIAFVSKRDGTEDGIYVMNADGSNQTRLTNNT